MNSMFAVKFRKISDALVRSVSDLADRIGRSASSAATRARAWSTRTETGAGPRVCRVMLDRYAWKNGR